MNKGLEALNEIKYTLQEVFDYSSTKQFDAIEKELGAFNIVKEKKVDIPLFISCRNLEDYNGICPVNGSPQLNQEEFDFLREMLRDE